MNGVNDTVLIRHLINSIRKKIKEAAKALDLSVDIATCIEIEVTDDLKLGKIASFKYPTSEHPYGVLKVKPRALKNKKYLEYVLTHELIHSALGRIKGDPHNRDFERLANKLGLPQKYQD